MYLNAKKYVGGSHAEFYPERKKPSETIQKLLSFPFPVNEVSFRVAYWRKANQIHAWFVKNVQDGKDECEETWVSKDQLRELLDTCNKVLANKELASELLPPQAGFFFGSQDYDEWYWQDIEETVKMLSELLADEEQISGVDFYYRSSW